MAHNNWTIKYFLNEESQKAPSSGQTDSNSNKFKEELAIALPDFKYTL